MLVCRGTIFHTITRWCPVANLVYNSNFTIVLRYIYFLFTVYKLTNITGGAPPCTSQVPTLDGHRWERDQRRHKMWFIGAKVERCFSCYDISSSNIIHSHRESWSRCWSLGTWGTYLIFFRDLNIGRDSWHLSSSPAMRVTAGSKDFKASGDIEGIRWNLLWLWKIETWLVVWNIFYFPIYWE